MKIFLLVEIESILGVNDTPELVQQAALKATKEAMRTHWKTDLQHTREDKFILADFKITNFQP